MRLALRVFFIFYAVAMLGVVIGHYMIELGEPHKLSIVWIFSGFSAAWCAMLALAFVLSKEPERISTRFWMIAMLLGAASCLAAFIAFFAGGDDQERWTSVISALPVLAFLVSTIFLLREPSANSKLGRIVLPVLWVIGAALVIASVFLPVAKGTGLEVLRLHEHWVTYHYSVVNNDSYSRIPWLQPIFGPVGCVFYLLTLILTVTSLVSLANWRLSQKRMLRSPLLPLLTSAVYLASFWVLVDVYWGWHFDLSERTWTAALGAMCWLAALLFAVAVAVKIGRSEVDTAVIHASLLFQFPLALFNMLMIPVYFQDSLLELPGLGCLILGLQIESFVLLFAIKSLMLEKRTFPEVTTCQVQVCSAQFHI